uniref:NAD-dependent epimerase/dehydratase family protein n=1 Tax=Pedobacter sp. TaxID=1411316 RepID=UPI003D7F87D5
MNILLTGGTGFLGKTIVNNIEGKLVKLGRTNCDINVDFVKHIPVLLQCFNLVIHAAGKAHSVPINDLQAQEFHAVNVNGTKNLLKGLELSPKLPESFIFISSVSVYGQDTGQLISEEFPLLATDPYGKSKIEAETIVHNWCEKNNVICTILRLPLIAGPNPPGNLKAMINGIKNGYYFNIAGGKAKKSMVLAEDVAQIIPKVSTIGGIYNLTDGYHPNF